MSVFAEVGAGAFGLVIGWITYRTLRRSTESSLSDLVTVVAALGGGTVVSIRFAEPELFASYGLGLAAGFFGYFVTAAWFDRRDRAALLAERAGAPIPPGAPTGAPIPPAPTTAPAPPGAPTVPPTPADSAGDALAAEASLPAQTGSWMGSGEQDASSHRRMRSPFEQ